MNKQQQIEKMESVYEKARIQARGTLGSMNKGEANWYCTKMQEAGYIKGEDFVELPCKVGDTLYTHKKVFGKWRIEELVCWGFHSDDRKILFMDCSNAKSDSPNSLRAFTIKDFGVVVFTDKYQAERRLAELTKE